MNSKITDDLLNELENCNHTQGVITTIEAVPLAYIWDNFMLQNKPLVEGIWIKRCKRCEKIIDWDKSLDIAKDEILSIANKIGNLSFIIGFNQKNRLLSSKKNDQNILAETASYLAIEPRYTLKQDVIIQQETLISIENALTKIRHSHLIYEQWGFQKVDPVGKGAIFNFYGEPGTGKTRTAEALAGELEVKFINVNYGEMESRFMGQTSKNIKLAFEAAKDQNALLFFDEADNVLSKRASTITQGVDSEINLSKTTMLKELEQFEGVCVFATNFQQVYDRAFVRRMGFDIKFEVPDTNVRKKIWNYHLVEGIPLLDDREKLLEGIVEKSEGMTGGDILKAMRIALPMAITDNIGNPQLKTSHLLFAIEKVQQAKEEIGKSILTDRQQISKELFGL